MKRSLKIAIYTVITLLIILIYLNPNTPSFKNYAHNLYDPAYTIYKREANYFLFSIYLKQNKDETKRYYGFAGNFFESNDNLLAKKDGVIVPLDSVTALKDPEKSIGDSILDYGPNAHTWMDDLGVYLDKNPNADAAELYKRFPHLDHNEKKIILGAAYNGAKKEKGMTEYKLRSLFPELFRDELYYQLNK